MKSLKTLLQEVTAGIKAWANANFSLGTHTHGNISNDGKVGTTANLPLITGTGGAVQAGSFGNQANTFCEGNDSRLSDARTPVAHTHTKSDVTDLLNSNFIPSANNSYDLGSSSYQWNNVHASAFKGNADSATEFESNQSVTLTGIIEGTASSKGGWTVNTNYKKGSTSRGGSNSNTYFKVASGTVSGSWNVYNVELLVNNTERFETALLQISIFVNNSGIVESDGNIKLIIKSIFGVRTSRFILVYKNNANSVSFELYTYLLAVNTGEKVRVICEFIRDNDPSHANIAMNKDTVGVSTLPEGYTVVYCEPSQSSHDILPFNNNVQNLGKSDLQWNNVYAKNYYYNGVAWGLDQANVWTGRQTYGAYLTSFGEARTDEWSTNSRTNAYLLSRRDTEDVSGFLISTFRQNAEQGVAGHIYGWDILENSTRYSGLRFTIDWDSTLNSGNGAYRVTLGTNTQGANPCNDLHITQLKTLNGINPGALSLPDFDNADPIDFRQWDVTGAVGPNYYTPTVNGWLNISIWDRSTNSIFVYRSGYERVGVFGNGSMASDGRLALLMPVKANATYIIIIKASANSDIHSANFFPCLGNV